MIDHFYYTADQGKCKEVCAKRLIVGCQAPEPVQTAVMCGLGYALRYAKQRSGKIAENARKAIEEETGSPVITNKNAALKRSYLSLASHLIYCIKDHHGEK